MYTFAPPALAFACPCPSSCLPHALNSNPSAATTGHSGTQILPPSTLSVAIITLNEEANLARTLSSVQFADEIVLIDSNSTDRTAEIAQSFGAKVFIEPWKGFAAQKNSAIDKCSSTWVLSIDADEELTPELQTELRAFLQSETANPEAYRIPVRHVVLLRPIRHGGYYPDLKLRLFRRNAAAAPSPIRFSERAVHESIQCTGPIGQLQSDLLHHGYPTLETYIEHMNRYSTLGAQLLVSRGRLSRNPVAFLANVVAVPVLTFLSNYIFRLGFLDGREGLLLHLYHSTYISWKYAKAWNLARPR
jgi:glycosyltransferase involved in cell wall biosynthesis